MNGIERREFLIEGRAEWVAFLICKEWLRMFYGKRVLWNFCNNAKLVYQDYGTVKLLSLSLDEGLVEPVDALGTY
jgi:hypothetical protein